MGAMTERWWCRETEEADVEVLTNGVAEYRVMSPDGHALAEVLNDSRQVIDRLMELPAEAARARAMYPMPHLRPGARTGETVERGEDAGEMFEHDTQGNITGLKAIVAVSTAWSTDNVGREP